MAGGSGCLYISAAPIDRRYCICGGVAIANVARTQQFATGFLSALGPSPSIQFRVKLGARHVN